MLRRYGRNIIAAFGLALAMSIAGQAAVTNFGLDVTAAIDASLQFFRTNNYFTTGGNLNAQGLVLLTLLEKHASADFNSPTLGYSGLAGSDGTLVSNVFPSGCPAAGCPTGDKLLAQYAVQRILNYSSQYNQYAYYDGNFMMALSTYLRTGGYPDVPNNAVPTAGSVKNRLDFFVDRTLAAQCPAAPAANGNGGFWSYSGCGIDASTTQFAAGGLAAARDFYTNNGSDAARVTSINNALTKVRSGYAMNVVSTGANEGGWGYNVFDAAGHQQTASGMWISELGGADVNDAAIQKAINFERNHYQYLNNNTRNDGWGTQSYGYHLFASSKAFGILESSAVVPNPGNTHPQDIGDDPASGDRDHQRDPTADPCARVANFGVGGCAGGANATPYTIEQPRWYYDYAWIIMNRQLATGAHGGPDVNGWDAVSNQAYFTLVLERSLGGVNAVPNCTAANSFVEIMADANHSYVPVDLGPITDPDNDPLTVKIDSARMDEPDQWGASFPFPAVVLAANGVQTGPAGNGVTVSNLIQVRAERNGLRQAPGNGRVYHIFFSATDASGAKCTGEAKVGVRFHTLQAPIDDYPGVNKDATLANPQ